MREIQNGSILCGGVGSGKSRTAIAYYFLEVCEGEIKINGIGDTSEMKKPIDLYIITTAKKRDSLEWERECAAFSLSTKSESLSGVKVIVDSWNNISKYVKVENSFFIFDEQRLVGAGMWVKSFIKISKKNKWILLSATPGDTWLDYIPVFIANNFYKNRTEFLRRHATYNRFTRYPQIEKFIEEGVLLKLRERITVKMEFERLTVNHDHIITTNYSKDQYSETLKTRWNSYDNRPIKTISELCYLLRKIVNSDFSRREEVLKIISKKDKCIIFYNFDYELLALRLMCEEGNINFSEWNGHKHQPIPESKKWAYLVQYNAGAEGWNCIETDTIIFYSQNYSYKTMVQAAGRIDRLNTPFRDLYYYHLRSNASIDVAIAQALKKKKAFNINKFI